MPQPESLPCDTILIAVTGMSPAVLTETIWALAHSKEEVLPSRIVVFTTLEGRERIRRLLFAEGRWEAFKRALELSCPRGYKSGTLKFGDTSDSIRVFASGDGKQELRDIRDGQDNAAMADQLLSHLRQFTEDPGTRIIASIAGGRKTMGAMLLAVMSLLGREQDRVTHVLVRGENDAPPDFWWPGCPGYESPASKPSLKHKHAPKVELAEVPFVPLRYLFERELRQAAESFARLHARVRGKAASVSTPELTLFTATARLDLSGFEISCSPTEFLYMLYFALSTKKGEPLLKRYSDLDETVLRELILKHKPAQPDFGHWTSELEGKVLKFDLKESPRKWASALRAKLAPGVPHEQIQRVIPGRGRLSIDLPPTHIFIKP